MGKIGNRKRRKGEKNPIRMENGVRSTLLELLEALVRYPHDLFIEKLVTQISLLPGVSVCLYLEPSTPRPPSFSKVR